LKTIRIVAADDSAVMRNLLTQMFAAERTGSQARMELCAAVPDGASCLHAVRTLKPDVVLMDLHMPGLGGMEAIARLRREWPRLPIILCSAYTEVGAGETLEAFARGASDYVTKPTGQSDAMAAMAWLWSQLAPKILAWTAPVAMPGVGYGASAVACGVEETKCDPMRMQTAVVGIGVSTGGPMALERLLPRLPRDFAVPVLVVQHMPKLFTRALAERLDRCCELRVREATAGTVLQPGTIWLAPGDSHMEVTASARGVTRLVLHQGEPENHCRPAVDVLFRSLAETYGGAALGLVLTGMGADGLEGSRAIAAAGGVVLAQDKASSAVWGMPGRVAAAGLARAVLPLDMLADELIALSSPREQKTVAAVRLQFSRPEVKYAIY